jgi:hypothetical protein
MSQNLDTLRTEMLDHLAAAGFPVFHGAMRQIPEPIEWDAVRSPDFRDFVKCAQVAGAKLIVFHEEAFSRRQVEEAIEDLDVARLTEEEYRNYGRRLKELREYEGFMCMLELSFDMEGRTYLFHLHTDWFAEFLNIRGEVDDSFPENDDESDDSMGGYYSKN